MTVTTAYRRCHASLVFDFSHRDGNCGHTARRTVVHHWLVEFTKSLPFWTTVMRRPVLQRNHCSAQSFISFNNSMLRNDFKQLVCAEAGKSSSGYASTHSLSMSTL